jgi:hypothetical protein
MPVAERTRSCIAHQSIRGNLAATLLRTLETAVLLPGRMEA